MRGRTHCLLVFLGLALIAASGLTSIADAQGGKLRFGVGPLQPTPSETKKAYEPFFAYLAKELGRDFGLTATTDWAGISVALAHKQVDLAWMGPWGYVLANDDSGARAIATAKYDGKPIYHAIVACKPGLVKSWPDGAKGKRVSFADVGSTSAGSSRPRGSSAGTSTPSSCSTTRTAPRTRPTRSVSPAARSTARPTSTVTVTP